ncbi:hypothetical protein [Salininema proteolyticum]|uniref:Uncharacterized protein n=1 Tax=Salininema proteolyticum TaxID=1607685 RepID=A0ABV8TY23_9ACTN
MKRFFLGWTWFVIALIVLQVGLAGWGAVSQGDDRTARFLGHVVNGGLLTVWLLLGLVFAAIARPGWKVVVLAAASLVMLVSQGFFTYSTDQSGHLSGISIALHAANGLGILTIQYIITRLTGKSIVRPTTPKETAA